MTAAAPQRLRVLPGGWTVRHLPSGTPVPDEAWLAVVRAPEGLTVVAPGGPDGWRALYAGESAHGVDAPGMLAALTGPLAAAGVPVFVVSTYHADLVLVPGDRLAVACAALRAAGHTVRT
ncbi:ACT domain-containing protein [Streptantibioticus cattleyicolor]|uniref:CASTOR ACT domain-containing protein n=1 Tax=Streptantibioticus cattleyicolor (strain ATCC 35852 / DSM 46488 / JCM 4925 / NBRC 14057 / NRRL 8057) TaxID=1003195 RepID=F8JMK3_STREN|nr:ACT domain-containing protein [Streptantibioticus cattleyicolor]AEW99314.1 hypothetical protein SCATT_p11210 [Streptantibioticus cattleyicolor NRRL 8057 = DSM 46488]CCB71647.1 conserved protein of unknown function [Streptantibioticus cattleyicolor NRRL 8057 = DSM 46488]